MSTSSVRISDLPATGLKTNSTFFQCSERGLYRLPRSSLSEYDVIFLSSSVFICYRFELFVDLVTKGFIFEKDNEELMEYLHDRAARAAQKALNRGDGDVRQVETRLKDDLSSAVYEKTKRKPQIVPRVLFLN